MQAADAAADAQKLTPAEVFVLIRDKLSDERLKLDRNGRELYTALQGIMKAIEAVGKANPDDVCPKMSRKELMNLIQKKSGLQWLNLMNIYKELITIDMWKFMLKHAEDYTQMSPKALEWIE